MDKQEAVRSMTVTMARFTDYISKHLPEDVLGKLRQLRDAEDHPLAKVVYDSMFENLAKAEALDRPSCQDTGVVQYFVKAGAGFPLLSEVRAVLTEAVLIATRRAPLRHNAVQIFQEKNTGNNTGERGGANRWVGTGPSWTGSRPPRWTRRCRPPPAGGDRR